MPRAIGKRIAAAGLAKTAAGSVREGMKVVMVVLDGLSICFEVRSGVKVGIRLLSL